MIYIRNKRTYKGPGIYIGRPSVLGNPFPVSVGREECIAKYKEYMLLNYATNPEYMNNIDSLVRKVEAGEVVILICWCFPLPCHGDVIKEFVEQIIKGELK